jgi:hypothetical protein
MSLLALILGAFSAQITIFCVSLSLGVLASQKKKKSREIAIPFKGDYKLIRN